MDFVTSVLAVLLSVVMTANASAIPQFGQTPQTENTNAVRGLNISPSHYGGSALIVNNRWGIQSLASTGGLQFRNPSVVQVDPSAQNRDGDAPNARYVAQNHGAIHVAVLPGTSQSVTSLNL